MLKTQTYSTVKEPLRSMFFPLFALLISLIIVNYVSISVGKSGVSASYVAYIIGLIIVLVFNPVYVFVYGFIMHIDLFNCFEFTGVKLVTLATMFIVFYLNPKIFFILMKNDKIKILVYLSLLFGLYGILINLGFNDNLTLTNAINSTGTFFGYLTIIPAFYFFLRQRKTLFVSLSVIASIFLAVYYVNFLLGTHLFALESGDRGTTLEVTRTFGYVIRQFIVLYFYLIPAILFANNIKQFHKIYLILIGLFAYLVLALAFYRLAMFYVAAGAILSGIFIFKYVKVSKIVNIVFISAIICILISFFFSKYLLNLKMVVDWTIDSFTGKAVDTSANSRLNDQRPILIRLFELKPWIGYGVINLKLLGREGMYGLVDIPILGTLTAFGILGMLIYYLKFYVLLTVKSISMSFYRVQLYRGNSFLFFAYLTLKAYIITMITFRLFYISWELTYDFQQAEFGFISGVFIALHYIINKQNRYTLSPQ
jgi:hypothetical protein